MRYGKEIKIIHPGEFYVSSEDELIGTLLGSCVAVCLIDHEKGLAGMNHFMLPGRISNRDIFADRSARYGITAINQLLEAMEKRGAVKKSITAKIFGGGHVLENTDMTNTIPLDNIRLAKIMMEIEDIHITHSNVGDNFTRKLLLDVKSGKVFLKKSTRKDVFEEIAKREAEYARRSLKNE
jgi:chemotaxis protein CheD